MMNNQNRIFDSTKESIDPKYNRNSQLLLLSRQTLSVIVHAQMNFRIIPQSAQLVRQRRNSIRVNMDYLDSPQKLMKNYSRLHFSVWESKTPCETFEPHKYSSRGENKSEK